MPELLAVATTAALDLRDLVRSLERHAPEGVAVAAAPGLLARSGPDGETALDGALRRGASVLVVAPGGPDLANHAGLTVAAARAAGLPVAAVVVAGPGGASDRESLREAGLEVVGLHDPQAPSVQVADWPLAAWAHAEPAAAGPGGVALAPHGAWEAEPGAVVDPRTAGRDRIDPVLTAIVAAEGPVLASRAFGLLVRAAGGHKLTTAVRTPLTASVHRLRQLGRLESEPTTSERGEDEVLRLAGAPAVRLRQLGPRELHEVPPSELAELLRRLLEAGVDDADLPRAALTAYGLTRMTARAEGCLARAWALVE